MARKSTRQATKAAKPALAMSMASATDAETPAQFVLRLIDETGYRDGSGNPVSLSSNIQSYFKDIEKIDTSMNPPMPLTRTGKFILQYTNHFPGVALSVGLLVAGGFDTPQALVDLAS